MQAHQTGDHQEATRASAGLAIWTFVWAGTVALAVFGPEHLWDAQPVASWAAIGVNLAAGVGWIVAHARYLRGIDELQRKINLEALAITFGVGYVVGFAYVAANKVDLIDLDADVTLFSLLLPVVYVIAIAVGHIRYR